MPELADESFFAAKRSRILNWRILWRHQVPGPQRLFLLHSGVRIFRAGLARNRYPPASVFERTYSLFSSCLSNRTLASSSVPLFHVIMAKARFACVFCAGFQDSQIIQQVFNFFPDRRKLLAFLSHRSADFAFEDLSHTRFCDVRFCE